MTQKERKEPDLPKGTIIPHNCRISLSPSQSGVAMHHVLCLPSEYPAE